MIFNPIIYNQYSLAIFKSEINSNTEKSNYQYFLRNHVPGQI